MRDVLGVDPGRRGAAALLRENTVVAAATWRPSTRNRVGGFRVRSYPGGEQTWVENPYEIGLWLSLRFRSVSLGAWFLAVEEAIVQRNPAVSIKIARAAGSLSGPLSAHAIAPVKWVRASAWRNLVLGLSPWTVRAKAKQVACEHVPRLVEGYPEVVAMLGESEDLADAVGIAIWLRSVTEEGP